MFKLTHKLKHRLQKKCLVTEIFLQRYLVLFIPVLLLYVFPVDELNDDRKKDEPLLPTLFYISGRKEEYCQQVPWEF